MMSSEKITKFYSFSTAELLDLNQIGGKALSLIIMKREGMPVPPESTE
jgi:phosphoenolpyruvate synthase/pyruvate phosphate dikinase